MKKQLVLIGGGHAHMVTLANLATITEQGHDVTVIGPSEFHYYSGMGPGMLAGTYRPDASPPGMWSKNRGEPFCKVKRPRSIPNRKW